MITKTFVMVVIVLSIVAAMVAGDYALFHLASSLKIWWYTVSAIVAGILWTAMLATAGAEIVVKYIEKATT
jgi:protein-S-isoprenylcysteine O-methyltransferase Ste14